MLERRPWVPAACEDLVQTIAGQTAGLDGEALFHEIAHLVAENRRIHDVRGINLNPATNVMNPRAEAMLAAGLGSRASLGYPGDKYEMGLEAIERSRSSPPNSPPRCSTRSTPKCASPRARWPTSTSSWPPARPGDAIIAPPADIGGHVTHHAAGAAGLYGLDTRARAGARPTATPSTWTRCARWRAR